MHVAVSLSCAWFWASVVADLGIAHMSKPDGPVSKHLISQSRASALVRHLPPDRIGDETSVVQ